MEEEIDFENRLVENFQYSEYENASEVLSALNAIKEYPQKESTVDSIHYVVNSGYTASAEEEKKIAVAAYGALRKVKPQNPEQASKVLSLYKTISFNNPEMAEDSIGRIDKIFKGFATDEQIQRECLSTLEALNGDRSKYDANTLSILDEKKKKMQDTIKAQEIFRQRGVNTVWQPRQVQSTKAENTGNTGQDSNDDVSPVKQNSAADDIMTKTGRNWREQLENERWERISKEIEKGTYGKDFGKGFDNDHGYGR